MKVISIDIGIINFAFTFWDCGKLKDFDKIDITTFIKENENPVFFLNRKNWI